MHCASAQLATQAGLSQWGFVRYIERPAGGLHADGVSDGKDRICWSRRKAATACLRPSKVCQYTDAVPLDKRLATGTRRTLSAARASSWRTLCSQGPEMV